MSLKKFIEKAKNSFFEALNQYKIEYRIKHNLPKDACTYCNGDGYVYGPEQGEINYECSFCNGTGKEI